MPVGKNAEGQTLFEEFTTAEMGLFYPMLVADGSIVEESIPLPESEIEEPEVPTEANPSRGLLGSGANNDDSATPLRDTTITVEKLNFKFQFVWQENLMSDRMAAREEARKKAAEETPPADEDNLANANP